MKNTDYRTTIIKRSYEFSLSTINLVKKTTNKDLATGIISKQLIRSVTSIGANIIEAQACATRKDFTNFIRHALKSSNETRYWIALLKDTIPEIKKDAEILLKEAQEISKILGSTIKNLIKKQ